MYRVILFSIFLLFLQFFTLSAVEKEEVFAGKNRVGFQIGGSSLIFGANYERLLFNHERFKTGVEMGAGLLSLNGGINQLFSFSQHHVELRVGAIGTRMIYSDQVYCYLGAGYRFQRPLGRTAFQVSFPILYGENSGFFLGAGVSISRVF